MEQENQQENAEEFCFGYLTYKTEEEVNNCDYRFEAKCLFHHGSARKCVPHINFNTQGDKLTEKDYRDKIFRRAVAVFGVLFATVQPTQ